MLDVLLVGAEELENLSTRYLAAVLRQHGFAVELSPFSAVDETDAVVEHAKRVQPRVVGLSIIFQYRAPEFLALAERIKQILPHTHITTGGHFASFTASELLRDYAALDSVVRGEGEYTLLELVQQLDTPITWDSILGLSFRDDGQILNNRPRALISNLDLLPFPSRDTPPQKHLGIGVTPFVGSRGCYCNCSFCSIRSFYGASHGMPQRFRGVRNLVDEIDMLYHDYDARFFIFNDDEWFMPGDLRYPRVEELERELRRRQLDPIMSIKCRVDDVEPDLFRRLLDLGIVRAYVGVESGSDHSLQTLNKKTTVAQNRRALETLNNLGMLADFGLIFFDPDSTLQDIRANLDFFHAMAGAGQAPLSFGRMEVYAGTPILDRLYREGRLTGNYMAWDYVIADPRVEMLFRLMYATMRQRHHTLNGLGKQCSLAYYELTMYKYVLKDKLKPALVSQLADIVARVNNHSLAMLEEMFDFTQHENIYDVNLVNDQAARWATRINLFDLTTQAELERWRAQAQRLVLARGAE
ncbi:MAG: B12-binding domain-containing radical SAM protein [Chloroflexi bacterium]|nr:B12-binding domain-containing radical SAM protein [Chloroflexota bacterium]